jgi:hypothetical protein
VPRVSTPDIEALVRKAVKYLVNTVEEIRDRDFLPRHVECVVVYAGRIAVAGELRDSLKDPTNPTQPRWPVA